MTPDPDPERERQRDHTGQTPQPQGQAYVPRPNLDKPASSRRGLWAAGLAAIVLAAGVAGQRLMTPVVAPYAAPSAPVAGVADIQQQKVFLVGIKDKDAAATLAAREKLKKGEIPPQLQAAPQPVRDAVRDGQMDLYTMRLLDWVAEDGDIVRIAVNGSTVGDLMLNNSGAMLTIPLKSGVEQSITITAIKDGVGGVTFGAVSSEGRMITRVMAVGQSETWTISFK